MQSGYHELEYCDGDESELHEKRKNCKKNPGHGKFIPSLEFHLQHLPENCRHQLLLDFTMAVVSLTIRVVVTYTSKERPDDYPFWERRGMYGRCFGSGWVRYVCRKFTDRSFELCPCPQCKKLPENDRERQWGAYMVGTALHVVYNTEESQHTTCDVDYDRDEDRDRCHSLQGVEVVGSDIQADWCWMYVVSHNRETCYKLETRIDQYRDLRGKLENMYGRSLLDKIRDERPVVCVSHPHGMSKHISVGMWIDEQEDWPFKWKYTTSTCPGSSGAPVFDLWDGKGVWLYPGRINHHNGCRKAGENESGGEGWRLM